MAAPPANEAFESRGALACSTRTAGGSSTEDAASRFAVDALPPSDVTPNATGSPSLSSVTRGRVVEDLERRVALRTEELSRINEELRASEARYRNVVETQTEFIVRWLPDGTFKFVNEAYCRYFEMTPAEVLGRSWHHKVHPDDLRLVFESISILTPQHPSATCENRVYRANGEICWTQWVNRAFFDHAGRPVEYQSVGRDVTALKTAADLLRQKEAHLTHLARLATMGEMVAGIAHEIGQPLHAAKTFADAARRHLESGRPGGAATAVDCMQEISDAVVRTVAIIRRLREFCRSRPANREAVSLQEVALEAVDLMSYEMRRVGAALRLELPETKAIVEGDRIQLVQVCVNLLKNACEAMEQTPTQQRRLEVRVAAVDRRATLVVKDSGCGLAHADPQRMFEAFYSTKPEGMGMGLSLSKSIAEAHGAKLWFEASENQPGMAFHLALAVREDRAC